MSPLKPVKPNYTPDYPRALHEQELNELLRPALFKRYSRETLVAGALLTGSMFAGCSAPTAAISGQKASAPEAKQLDPNLDQKVDQFIKEVLGDEKASWSKRAYLTHAVVLPMNPPLKAPVIPISFGNSMMGVFDVEQAREATRKLFELYGIKLETAVPVNGDGYQFSADGFNREYNTGFELRLGKPVPNLSGRAVTRQEPEGAADALENRELAHLSEDIESGKVNIFVANADAYPLMDGDQGTPLRYYLASVVDYLN